MLPLVVKAAFHLAEAILGRQDIVINMGTARTINHQVEGDVFVAVISSFFRDMHVFGIGIKL